MARVEAGERITLIKKIAAAMAERDWDDSSFVLRQFGVEPRGYVDESCARRAEGASKELVDFVDANVPRLIAYNVYLSDDGARITVLHVHPDSASLEYHMGVAAPVFRRFVDLVTLTSIHVYGEPSEKVLKQPHDKARLLGRGSVAVEVDALHAGFTRFASQA